MFILKDISANEHRRLLEEIARHSASKTSLTIGFHHGGGDMREGLNICRLINASPVRIIGLVTGKAESVAVTIFQSCHRRLMLRGSTLKNHFGFRQVSMGIYFNKKMRRANYTSGVALQNEVVKILGERSGLSRPTILKILAEDKEIGAEEALSLHLCDVIVDTIHPHTD